jgi:hypothetical protein
MVRREVWEKTEAEKRRRQLEMAQTIEKAKRRAVLDHSYLTGNEVWDRYLQKVHELQEADLDELDALEKVDRATSYEAPEKTAERRFHMSLLRERIGAREQCISLPKRLAEAGKGDGQ